MFALSFFRFNRDNDIKLIVCTPEDGPEWNGPVDIRGGEIAAELVDLGAEIRGFRNARFGSRYPHSNKIYALSALPPREPFLFLDTDFVITGDLSRLSFDFDRPSMYAGRATWPSVENNSIERDRIWESLYRKFGLTTEGWIREHQPPGALKRYPYFNAARFYYRRADVVFDSYRRVAEAIEDAPPPELEGQTLYPWLDQISLPIVMRSLNADKRHYNMDYFLNPVAHHYHVVVTLFLDRHREKLLMAREFASDDRWREYFIKSRIFSQLADDEKYNEILEFADREVLKPSEFGKRMRDAGYWLR